MIASADRTPLSLHHLVDRLEIARRDRLPGLALAPGRLTWGTNLDLGGLTALRLSFRRPQ